MHRSLMSYWAGMSGIFLAAQELNLMLELLYSNDAGLESGEVVRESGLIVSPGLRFAIDLGNLQIVPGFAFPVRMGSFTPETALFGYLSFEHPF